jgi:hypothetical protein
LQCRFLLYPFYCPLTPQFPFSLEKAPASQVIPSNKQRIWADSALRDRSLLLSACHKSVFTQFTLTRTFPFTDKNYFVWKYFRKYCHKKIKYVVIFINITINITLLLLLQSPHGARGSTAISQMRPNI